MQFMFPIFRYELGPPQDLSFPKPQVFVYTISNNLLKTVHIVKNNTSIGQLELSWKTRRHGKTTWINVHSGHSLQMFSHTHTHTHTHTLTRTRTCTRIHTHAHTHTHTHTRTHTHYTDASACSPKEILCIDCIAFISQNQTLFQSASQQLIFAGCKIRGNSRLTGIDKRKTRKTS